jgi:high-affinity K+ transport system ATPase subunit B
VKLVPEELNHNVLLAKMAFSFTVSFVKISVLPDFSKITSIEDATNVTPNVLLVLIMPQTVEAALQVSFYKKTNV